MKASLAGYIIRLLMKSFRTALLLVVIASASAFLGASGAHSQTRDVVVLTVDGIINPVMADYIADGIAEAEVRQAVAAVIQMDTPGGLDTAMRDIVQSIVAARVPVIVYVSPQGARAASAGVFITVSAHVAAMAPNTAIGAASPVSIGESGEQEISETMREKVMNDAAAYIRSLAATRSRNVEWAELAVREAVSATETEALDLRVIDLIATDLRDLLNKVNGRVIQMSDGRDLVLDTAAVLVRHLEMTWIEEFLLAISDPNIAFILLGLAGIGLWVEITNPGLIFPGTFGAVALILSLFSLGNLPVNIAGVLLIAVAFILFVVEAINPGFGVAFTGGMIALIIGSLILFKGGPMFQVDLWLIAVVAVCLAAFFAFIIFKLMALRKLKVQTGYEEIIGEKAEVRAALDPQGTVFYRGELWNAVSDSGRIEAGQQVVVKKIEGLKLTVGKL